MNEFQGKFDAEQLGQLILLSLDESASGPQIAQLNEILRSSPGSCEFYLEFLETYTAICQSAHKVQSTTWDNDLPLDCNVSLDGINMRKDVFLDEKEDAFACYELSQDDNLNQALLEAAEFARTAPEVIIDKPIEEPDEPQPIRPAKFDQKISKFSIFVLTFSSAAMLFFAAIVFFSPVRPVVAVLSDSIDAEWIGAKDTPAIGDVLRQGKMIFAKGFAEITFDGGAVVVVEAPAVIELESPMSMFVSSGKVSAVVSGYAIGFTVNTPSGRVVDLGTEFGVNVDEDGSCSLHMFKGKANLIAQQDGIAGANQIVNGDEARSIDIAGTIKEINLGEKIFARYIDSEEDFIWRGEGLSLADIVGGGNGFGTGKANYGIDIQTGSNIAIDRTSENDYGDGRYIHSPNPFVDGVFIPDGGNGPVQISSTGLDFSQCPDTTGKSVGDFLNGAWHDYDAMMPSRHLLKLDGITFQAPGQAFFMHANKGITFDLDAIRGNLLGVDVRKFKAIAGVSDTVLEIWTESSRVDFWVLVDGQVKLEQINVKPDDGSFDIDIPLTDQDRFLTIITTDSGTEHGGASRDWALFAEPTLELEQK